MLGQNTVEEEAIFLVIWYFKCINSACGNALEELILAILNSVMLYVINQNIISIYVFSEDVTSASLLITVSV